MSDYKLLPCPFCGSDSAGTTWHHGYWSVCCGYYYDGIKLPPPCGQDWGEFGEEGEAVAAWNTRAQLSRQKGE